MQYTNKEIRELKKKVDLDRERMKSKILAYSQTRAFCPSCCSRRVRWVCWIGYGTIAIGIQLISCCESNLLLNRMRCIAYTSPKLSSNRNNFNFSTKTANQNATLVGEGKQKANCRYERYDFVWVFESVLVFCFNLTSLT